MHHFERLIRIVASSAIAAVLTMDAVSVWHLASTPIDSSTTGAVEPSDETPLVEGESCNDSIAEAEPTPTTAVAVAATPPGGTRVTFTVLPTTLVRVATNGDVLAVATNTGCAPRATDTFVDDSGNTHDGDTLRALVLQLEFSGDWRTPGEWHSVG